MINFYWNRTRYLNLIKIVDENLTNGLKFGDAETKRIIISGINYMKKLTTIFWFFALVTANCMCIKSAVEAIYCQYKSSFNLSVKKLSFFPRFCNYCSIKICKCVNIFYYLKQNEAVDMPQLILPSWFPLNNSWMNYWIAFLIQYYIMNIGEVKIMEKYQLKLKLLNFQAC